MPILRKMPPVVIDKAALLKFGKMWKKNGGSLSRTPPCSSSDLGQLFDRAVGKSLAELLGGIPIASPSARVAVVLAVGAKFNGQASFVTLTNNA